MSTRQELAAKISRLQASGKLDGKSYTEIYSKLGGKYHPNAIVKAVRENTPPAWIKK